MLSAGPVPRSAGPGRSLNFHAGSRRHMAALVERPFFIATPRSCRPPSLVAACFRRGVWRPLGTRALALCDGENTGVRRVSF